MPAFIQEKDFADGVDKPLTQDLWQEGRTISSKMIHCISKVAHLQDMEEIYAWEQSRLKQKYLDENECQLLSWQAPWRKESLEHYLNLGWSFLLRSEEGGGLLGYYLAQPLLFYRSQTQSLWVEYLQYERQKEGNEKEKEGKEREIQKALCELAIQNAREKHLQQVLFYRAEPSESLYNAIEPSRQASYAYEEKTLSCWVVSTTRVSKG